MTVSEQSDSTNLAHNLNPPNGLNNKPRTVGDVWFVNSDNVFVKFKTPGPVKAELDSGNNRHRLPSWTDLCHRHHQTESKRTAVVPILSSFSANSAVIGFSPFSTRPIYGPLKPSMSASLLRPPTFALSRRNSFRALSIDAATGSASRRKASAAVNSFISGAPPIRFAFLQAGKRVVRNLRLIE